MAFLITWNPQQRRWHGMPTASPVTLSGQLYKDWWGVRSKSVAVGSRLFLLRQGVEPKGIVGSGWATSAPRLRTPPEPGRINHVVDAVFDMMLDPDKYPPLSWQTFTAPPLNEVHWTTQSSGISVPDELETEWRQHVRKVLGYLPDALNENVIDSDEMVFPEGRGSYRLHRQIERNSQLINAAKAKAKRDGRLHCWVCSFDFAKFYGARGEDFIEAHHTIPVSQLGDNATTKIEDIAMVCSNCHRMLHRNPWLSIAELHSLLIKQPS
jgi:5-methylcytosine-specific restriction endonuclease McrA